jgi:hypothetical protein
VRGWHCWRCASSLAVRLRGWVGASTYVHTPPLTPSLPPTAHTTTNTRHFYQPENQEDVEAIVAECAAAQRRLRVVGSGLSPNGVGFSDQGMMSMALLDRVLWVDPESQQVQCFWCVCVCVVCVVSSCARALAVLRECAAWWSEVARVE